MKSSDWALEIWELFHEKSLPKGGQKEERRAEGTLDIEQMGCRILLAGCLIVKRTQEKAENPEETHADSHLSSGLTQRPESCEVLAVLTHLPALPVYPNSPSYSCSQNFTCFFSSSLPSFSYVLFSLLIKIFLFLLGLFVSILLLVLVTTLLLYFLNALE